MPRRRPSLWAAMSTAVMTRWAPVDAMTKGLSVGSSASGADPEPGLPWRFFDERALARSRSVGQVGK